MSRVTRRAAIVRFLGAAAAIPLGMHELARVGWLPAHAREEMEEEGEPEELFEPSEATLEPGHHFFSLRSRGAEGPLDVSKSKNKYGEIGFSAFEDDAFVMHMPFPAPGGTREWMGRRIGTFSIKDGALMVDAVGELNEIGCFALEMRHQAYRDHKYIRSNWMAVDPPTGTVEIKTDGEWDDMVVVARATGVGAVRPQGEWNRLLFTAQGRHFEGWVNGEKIVEGEDYRFGSGRVSLITMRMDKASYRVRFRNLHVWEGVLPDPTSVWG